MEIWTCSGFVLAGGLSRRMEQNKALLPYKGAPLILTALHLLSLFTPDVRIVGPPEIYSGLGFPVTPDLVQSQGPLSGILTSLRVSVSPFSLILACDMPRMISGFIRYLLASGSGMDAVVFKSREGLVEPVCSLYAATALPVLERNFFLGKLRLSDSLDHLKVRYVTEEDLTSLGATTEIFQSVNTPQEYQDLTSGTSYNPY
jgi:molybdopterin-guanine dinucleotide biosynthesis protein A